MYELCEDSQIVVTNQRKAHCRQHDIDVANAVNSLEREGARGFGIEWHSKRNSTGHFVVAMNNMT